jgi:hypothetical protein
MPIVNPDDEVGLAEQPAKVVISAPQYRGVTVDTRYTPSSALLTYIEGSSWTVNYYSQVLNSDNQVQGQQLDLEPIYQPYKLVKGFELKVTTPLTTSQNTESGSMQTTGAAHVYPFLIPNVGDMFLADAGDGREAVFKVTVVERKSLFKETVHYIEYVLIDYATTERLTDFAAKTVSTVRFVREFLDYGQNPMLYEEEFLVAADLARLYHEVVKVYFNGYFSHEFKTLIAPKQPLPVYDHFLAKAVKTFFENTTAPQLSQMRILNADGDVALKTLTFWDALAERRKSLMPVISRRTGLMSTKTFMRDPMFESIYYSGIPFIVYPKDPTVTVGDDTRRVTKEMADQVLVDAPGLPLDLDEGEEPPVPVVLNPPLIHPVLVDNYYVLSRAFYRGIEAEMSVLESCVQDYLDNKAPDNPKLLSLLTDSYKWGGLERFYYVPIILMLVKASIRSL